MRERVRRDPRREIGDATDSGDAHADGARHDDFGHGRHPHGIRAERGEHAHLGGRLVRGPEQASVHAFL